MDAADLIYDWNTVERVPRPGRGRVELNDETLRDGLQSPSVTSPSIEDKVRLLHLMAELGIDAADIGLPGAGPHVVADVTRLAQEIVDHKLAIAPNCAARTIKADITPVIEIAQKVGIPIEVACFIGSSPVRQYTEGWNLDRMLAMSEEAVAYASGEGLPVMFVTEDTTRAAPADLKRLYTAAVEAGARRVCVADTVGHATPDGTAAVIRFIREVVDATGEDVAVDWHGHKDRGMSVINTLTAVEAGADRVHATALGIGERVGNTPMDLVMVNMKLMGWIDNDLSALPEYCELTSRTTAVPLPDNYPVIGRDAFRTGTGVHAAAIAKARAKGDEWLADLVYSGIPASYLGRRQRVDVGPMSGESNVLCWLDDHDIEADERLVAAIFRAAKESNRVLDDDEILSLCSQHAAAQS